MGLLDGLFGKKDDKPADFSGVGAGAESTLGRQEDMTPAQPVSMTTASYTVQSGDSLSKIAKHHLGDAQRWHEIYEMNRAAIGDNPDMIHPGLELTLPGGSTGTTTTQPASNSGGASFSGVGGGSHSV